MGQPPRKARPIHVSVAWPYANGDLHVGHLAGSYLPADIFARYHRLAGNDVLMVSGSDAHGTPISVEADARGVTARSLFEHYHHRFLETQRQIGISYDLFTHTDTENHHRIAQDFFLRLLENDCLYKDKQRLLYSESEQRFLPDRYVEGECYFCGYEDARGDQCDECGNLLDATRLGNPRSKNSPEDHLIIREAEHYFLDLSRVSASLLEYLREHEDHWRANVLQFTRNMIEQGIEQGLRGRAFTRDLDWGIRVPLPGWEEKRIYVWFEALMGYFTASVEWARNCGEPEAWKRWWYNPEARIYNFLGKDNIPFHTIIWQAELMGASGIYHDGQTPLQLPFDVPANEFMNIEGQQFSTSRNWAIWLPDILERYQPDALRYYVTVTMPESSDTDFAWDGFLQRVNNELVAAWGNLANRMLSFAYRHFDGAVPHYDALNAADRDMLARAEAGFAEVGELIERVRLRDALAAAMRIARAANAYLERRRPWHTIREDRADAARCVYCVLRVIDNLKILLAPFLPFSAQRLHELLGYEGQLFGVQKIETIHENERAHEVLTYDASAALGRWKKSQLPPGQALQPPQPLFVKLDADIVSQEREQLGAPRTERPL